MLARKPRAETRDSRRAVPVAAHAPRWAQSVHTDSDTGPTDTCTDSQGGGERGESGERSHVRLSQSAAGDERPSRRWGETGGEQRRREKQKAVMREPRREALWRVRRPLGDKRLYRSSLNGQRAEAVIFLPAVYTNSFLLGVLKVRICTL